MSSSTRALLLGLAIAVAPFTAEAQAGTYYLSSTNVNTVTVSLLAGQWSIGVSNGGWSPWNYVEGCDANGANCWTGYHTLFYYTIDNGPVTKYGIDGTIRPDPNPNLLSDFYATPELALAHALPPFLLDVASPVTLRLFIQDFCPTGNPCYFDNAGGVDVTVAQAQAGVTVTPEPASLALMAAGLTALGVVARRRRLNA